MKGIQFTLGWTYAAALLACAPAANQDFTPEGEQYGNMDMLPIVEQITYIDDLQYLYNLTKPNVAVELNYADPRQHSLVMARLKLSGKTPDNSPYLFSLIENQRQGHIASNLKAGSFAPRIAAHSLTQSSADIQAQHFAEKGSLTKFNSLQAEVTGAASTTFPGGTVFTRIDVGATTSSGLPVASVKAVEQYVNPAGNVGANLPVTTAGKVSLSTAKRYVVSSFRYEEYPDGSFSSSFVKNEFGSSNSTVVAAIPTFAVGSNVASVTAPRANITAPLDQISVCMNRAWTHDCDYIVPPTGLNWPVQMPLAGTVKITNGQVFDAQRVFDIRSAVCQSPPQDPGVSVGSVKLVLTNTGGGCDVTDGNTLNAKMCQFWQGVSLPDPTTFEWDLTAFFDDGCAQVQDAAKLTAIIPLTTTTAPGVVPFRRFETSLTITNDPVVIPILRPGDIKLEPLTLTNSCLAEGTQIQLSDGKLAPIETLRIGQQVFNPYDREDHALLITDTAKGSERSPMVRIRSEHGATLLLTEMHPLSTPDRGMVQARRLKTGDVVMTKNGPSKLTEVSREPYTGQVYNLKVGSTTEMASLGQDQTIVYANGFIVGDGQIQSKYESLAVKQESRTVEQIPERWRRDYLRSPQQK